MTNKQPIRDIKIEELRKNCFRQSKVPGEFMFQMRVPGGTTDAKHLLLVHELAEKYGNGTFHFGTRQTFNIPGIKYENISKVNERVEEYIKAIEVERCGLDLDVDNLGYPCLAPRNISGCVGADHCIKANAKVPALANKIEKIIFPSNYHIKVNIAGCPNDCIKAHMSDFGIIGITEPQYDPSRCVGCEGCLRACKSHSTDALTFKNGIITRNKNLCVGCGECVEACPTRAFTRSKENFYRVLIGGRTSKKSPRIGKVFVDFVTEEVLLNILRNWEAFSAHVLKGSPRYLHGGHLMDMAGYKVFKEWMLKDIVLNPEAKVADRVNWVENEYRSNYNVK
ncbi:MAG: sulfite reductase subunit C [Cetobacterium sp.]|uniref:sulfite reductase subunit C n=1 Tax=Cetobacterium sp. TaxID=2071632 RepID=UPI003F2E1EB9